MPEGGCTCTGKLDQVEAGYSAEQRWLKAKQAHLAYWASLFGFHIA